MSHPRYIAGALPRLQRASTMPIDDVGVLAAAREIFAQGRDVVRTAIDLTNDPRVADALRALTRRHGT